MARTSKFVDSTSFLVVFSRFDWPGERLCRCLEPLGRAFRRQFGSSETKLNGQVRPKAAQDGTPDRPRAAQEHRTARQATRAGQSERA